MPQVRGRARSEGIKVFVLGFDTRESCGCECGLRTAEFFGVFATVSVVAA